MTVVKLICDMLHTDVIRHPPPVTWLLVALAALQVLWAVFVMATGAPDTNSVYTPLTYALAFGGLSTFGFLGYVPLIGDDANQFARDNHRWLMLGAFGAYMLALLGLPKIGIDLDVLTVFTILFAACLVLIQIRDQ